MTFRWGLWRDGREGGAIGFAVGIIILGIGTAFTWGIGALIGLYHGKQIERVGSQPKVDA